MDALDYLPIHIKASGNRTQYLAGSETAPSILMSKDLDRNMLLYFL
jgi:hypothetical protein